MKFNFDATLNHQTDAINAVVEVFEGQPTTQTAIEMTYDYGGAIMTETGTGNGLSLADAQLLQNVQKIQARNNIKQVESLQGRDFSIEMETGTGKTYVYLRTIFELSQKYGFKKFIIVVPSVAIREGVLKSIDMMKKHFAKLYDNERFNSFIYNSKKLNSIRNFASTSHIQIMVINIQSFQRDVEDTDPAQTEKLNSRNIIHRVSERLSGNKPIEFIQSTNPIVIIDEPQSVDNTPKAKLAIKTLNALFTLRYSATHRQEYNLLYKLDPIQAYKSGLVKQIEVASVREVDNFNQPYIKLLKTDNKKGIKAQLEIHVQKGDDVRTVTLWVKQRDDLYQKSSRREMYREGYIVQAIDCTPSAECIEFSNGKFLEMNDIMGDYGDDILKAQVKTTVETHLKKEKAFNDKGIKVLSLFFIDRVSNYRIYNTDGSTALGKIGQWFEEAYAELCATPRFKELATQDLSKIHNGYFSKDRHGKLKDTSGKTQDDANSYNLIMRDKERLLDLQEPLRFIFSHSALREGWDNPNIFQICTLNESKSIEKKRQEIGRGLRLPVNQQGLRIQDDNINRLTVIANEHYHEFARKLQNEFEKDWGVTSGLVKKIAFANILRGQTDGTEAGIGQEESEKIWHQLCVAGYLNSTGLVQPKFAPQNPLDINKEYADIEGQIIDIIKDYTIENHIKNANRQKTQTPNEEVLEHPEFKELWDTIKQRTRYKFNFETEKLINNAVKNIQAMEKIESPSLVYDLVGLDITDAGTAADRMLDQKTITTIKTATTQVLPDILTYLQQRTGLTRRTLLEILQKSSHRLPEFQTNPQRFMTLVDRAISSALQSLMLEGIEYEKVENLCWDLQLLKNNVSTYSAHVYKVKNKEKHPFNIVICDSGLETDFAEELDHSEPVLKFIKLPHWFKINTPIGSYNPDWALVGQQDEKIYFVCETKGSTDVEQLRGSEKNKFKYGKKHFEAIGMQNFVLATKLKGIKKLRSVDKK